MGKTWQERINGRWRTVTACARCGATLQVTMRASHVCKNTREPQRETIWDGCGDSLVPPHEIAAAMASEMLIENNDAEPAPAVDVMRDGFVVPTETIGPFVRAPDAPTYLQVVGRGTRKLAPGETVQFHVGEPAPVVRCDDGCSGHARDPAVVYCGDCDCPGHAVFSESDTAAARCEPRLTPRHVLIALAVCAAIAAAGYARAVSCGWHP